MNPQEGVTATAPYNLVDVWMLYDNSGEKPLLIDAGGKK